MVGYTLTGPHVRRRLGSQERPSECVNPGGDYLDVPLEVS